MNMIIVVLCMLTRENPGMVKIFDPHNLGASCGSCGHTVMPRWVLSRIKPVPLEDSMPLPAARKRWWQRLFPPIHREHQLSPTA
jgi:hypothetical protein